MGSLFGNDLVLNAELPISQAKAEGIVVEFSELLAIAVTSKNAMLQYGGVSPFQAVIGRTPPMLLDLDQANLSALTDDEPGPSRSHSRLRELAVIAMVEAQSKARLALAEHARTRVSAQQLELSPGDLVDLYRAPANKDLSGWRGPCRVASTSQADDGIISVQWQGRRLQARIADIRRSTTYATFLYDDDLATAALIRFAG